MSLVVPQGYNPYNTSFAAIALQGVQIAQAERRAQEAVAQKGFENIMDSVKMGADLRQRQVDNNLREREFGFKLEQTAFENRLNKTKLDMAGQELDLNRDKFGESTRQFDITAGFTERQIGQADSRIALDEKRSVFEDRRLQIDEGEFAAKEESRKLAREQGLDVYNIQLQQEIMKKQEELIKFGQSGETARANALKASYDVLDKSVDDDVKGISESLLTLKGMTDDLAKLKTGGGGGGGGDPLLKPAGGGVPKPSGTPTEAPPVGAGTSRVPSGGSSSSPSVPKDGSVDKYFDPDMFRRLQTSQALGAAALSATGQYRMAKQALMLGGDDLDPETKTKYNSIIKERDDLVKQFRGSIPITSEWMKQSLQPSVEGDALMFSGGEPTTPDDSEPR